MTENALIRLRQTIWQRTARAIYETGSTASTFLTSRILPARKNFYCDKRFAYFLMKRLLEGQHEVEIIYRNKHATLTIFFDPLKVKGETCIVEELTDRQGVHEELVLFLRNGGLYKDTQDKSAYLA